MQKIVCARCGKQEMATGTYQKYCSICQPIVKREQKTAAEARRRMRCRDQINANNRKRYAQNPDKYISRSNEYYHRVKDDPLRKEKTKIRHAINIDKWLDKRDFGGNWYNVFDRDSGACRTCGSTENLVVHHIDFAGWGVSPDAKNNDMSNLILLCGSCHMKIHRKKQNRKR